MHYNISGRASRAVELAEELHRRNPDHPEAARMLGRCLIDQDPQRALPFLEQVCQQNRSADYLFDLARCYQLIGDRAKAEQMHWETLQQNPYLSASWTNLFVFGGHQDRLWPFVEPMLEHGCGLDDEYFLVAVVELALQLRRTVPVRWFPAAVRRYQILQTHPGFRDERVRLQRALLVWARVRPGDVPSASDVPSGFFPSLLARFVWPRRAWIPRG
jgi:tetratricopeptide (TPR) repeat protein